MDLEIDIESKQMYLRGLETRLTTVDLEAGLDRLREGQVYSEAVPPLFPISPNKKLIFVLFVFGSLFFGIVVIIFRQAVKNFIFTLAQLNNLKSLENKYDISFIGKRNFFGLKRDVKKLSPFHLQFHSDFNKFSGIGCVVDISRESKSQIDLSDVLSIELMRIKSENYKTILYVSNSSSKLFKGNLKNIGSMYDPDRIEGLPNPLEIRNIYDKEKGLDQIFSTYSNKDKADALVSLGAKISDLEKFKIISKCDYYILIGKRGKFDFNTAQKFVDKGEANKNRCLALFLTN